MDIKNNIFNVNDQKTIYDIYKNNYLNLTDDELDAALCYLSDEYLYKIVVNKLHKDESYRERIIYLTSWDYRASKKLIEEGDIIDLTLEERKVMIKGVAKDGFQSYIAFINLYNKNLLNDKEREILLDAICKSSSACVQFLYNFKPSNLTPKELEMIIDSISKSSTSIKTFLSSPSSPSIPERLRRRLMIALNYAVFELTALINDDDAKLSYEDRLFIAKNYNYSRNHYPICLGLIKNYVQDDDARKITFDILLNNDNMDCIMELFELYSYKLRHEERRQLYFKHGEFLFNKTKYSEDKYFSFCKRFFDFLDERKINLLCNKISKGSYRDYELNELINSIPKGYLTEKIEGAMLMRQINRWTV